MDLEGGCADSADVALTCRSPGSELVQRRLALPRGHGHGERAVGDNVSTLRSARPRVIVAPGPEAVPSAVLASASVTSAQAVVPAALWSALVTPRYPRLSAFAVAGRAGEPLPLLEQPAIATSSARRRAAW